MVSNRSAKAIVEMISISLRGAEKARLTKHLVVSTIMLLCTIRRDGNDIYIVAPSVFHRDWLCDDIFQLYQSVYNICEMTPEEGRLSRVIIECKSEGRRWFHLNDGLPEEWMSHNEAKEASWR